MACHCKLTSIALLVAALSCSKVDGQAVGENEPSGQKSVTATDSANTSGKNRLARETSPYLLLHADNPVDWYPWGPEAFEKAKREDKLVFLSVGYSSCHWCHVMEREAFSDQDIAKILNDDFVSIKVDREERPDVDDVYMTALSVYYQQIGAPGGGGWPLSMFLTPEGKPIAGGTYFPPQDRPGMVGFPNVLRRINESWHNDREQLEKSADAMQQFVRIVMRPRLVLQPTPIDQLLVSQAVEAIVESYDPAHGGVDFNPNRPSAPKFPAAAKLALLQHAIRHEGNEEAQRALYGTLDAMAAGGIYDHLGGGFHRYSTDRAWLVPHFEKMLSDQSQLADIYVEAYRQTRNPLYREIAEGIFRFVLEEMTDASGRFYSSLDADTDHIEGKYYVWTKAEIDARLSADDAQLFRQAFGMDGEQLFEHGYVLHRPQSIEQLARERNTTPEELTAQLDQLRRTMLEARQERERPFLDDKTLTSWNGLMIGALARGGTVLKRPEYIQAAQDATTFIQASLRDDQGRLLHSFCAGRAGIGAYLDDYACLVDGLLALHDATGDGQWLKQAAELTDQQDRLFWDETTGAYYFTSDNHDSILARTKNAYDSAVPSGNSVSARNLVRLAALTGEDHYRDRAQKIMEVFSRELNESPASVPILALAAGEYLDRFPAPSADGATNDSADTALNADTAIALADEATKSTKSSHRIEAKAYLSVDRLPAGKTSPIVLVIDIEKDWHINTNPAMPDFLVPTELSIKSKLGTKLEKIEYPKGTKLTIPGFDEPIHVYAKQAILRGTLTVPADAAGKTEEVEIKLKYQACDDERCLAPTTLTLKYQLPVATAGESVKSINQKFFGSDESKNK